MIEPEELTLDWQGPVIPTAFQADDDPDIMQQPCVYICETKYDTKTAIYVGQTRNFIDRMCQHISATLGLTYWLRGSDGTYDVGEYEPKARHYYIEDLKNVRAHQAMAADAIERMSWYYAEVDPDALLATEGILIRATKRLEKESLGSAVSIICDNGNLGRMPSMAAVIHNAGAERPVALFGSRLVWPFEDFT